MVELRIKMIADKTSGTYLVVGYKGGLVHAILQAKDSKKGSFYDIPIVKEEDDEEAQILDTIAEAQKIIEEAMKQQDAIKEQAFESDDED